MSTELGNSDLGDALLKAQQKRNEADLEKMEAIQRNRLKQFMDQFTPKKTDKIDPNVEAIRLKIEAQNKDFDRKIDSLVGASNDITTNVAKYAQAAKDRFQKFRANPGEILKGYDPGTEAYDKETAVVNNTIAWYYRAGIKKMKKLLLWNRPEFPETLKLLKQTIKEQEELGYAKEVKELFNKIPNQTKVATQGREEVRGHRGFLKELSEIQGWDFARRHLKAGDERTYGQQAYTRANELGDFLTHIQAYKKGLQVHIDTAYKHKQSLPPLAEANKTALENILKANEEEDTHYASLVDAYNKEIEGIAELADKQSNLAEMLDSQQKLIRIAEYRIRNVQDLFIKAENYNENDEIQKSQQDLCKKIDTLSKNVLAHYKRAENSLKVLRNRLGEFINTKIEWNDDIEEYWQQGLSELVDIMDDGDTELKKLEKKLKAYNTVGKAKKDLNTLNNFAANLQELETKMKTLKDKEAYLEKCSRETEQSLKSKKNFLQAIDKEGDAITADKRVVDNRRSIKSTVIRSDEEDHGDPVDSAVLDRALLAGVIKPHEEDHGGPVVTRPDGGDDIDPAENTNPDRSRDAVEQDHPYEKGTSIAGRYTAIISDLEGLNRQKDKILAITEKNEENLYKENKAKYNFIKKFLRQMQIDLMNELKQEHLDERKGHIIWYTRNNHGTINGVWTNFLNVGGFKIKEGIKGVVELILRSDIRRFLVHTKARDRGKDQEAEFSIKQLVNYYRAGSKFEFKFHVPGSSYKDGGRAIGILTLIKAIPGTKEKAEATPKKQENAEVTQEKVESTSDDTSSLQELPRVTSDPNLNNKGTGTPTYVASPMESTPMSRSDSNNPLVEESRYAKTQDLTAVTRALRSTQASMSQPPSYVSSPPSQGPRRHSLPPDIEVREATVVQDTTRPDSSSKNTPSRKSSTMNPRTVEAVDKAVEKKKVDGELKRIRRTIKELQETINKAPSEETRRHGTDVLLKNYEAQEKTLKEKSEELKQSMGNDPFDTFRTNASEHDQPSSEEIRELSTRVGGIEDNFNVEFKFKMPEDSPLTLAEAHALHKQLEDTLRAGGTIDPEFLVKVHKATGLSRIRMVITGEIGGIAAVFDVINMSSTQVDGYDIVLNEKQLPDSFEYTLHEKLLPKTSINLKDSKKKLKEKSCVIIDLEEAPGDPEKPGVIKFPNHREIWMEDVDCTEIKHDEKREKTSVELNSNPISGRIDLELAGSILDPRDEELQLKCFSIRHESLNTLIQAIETYNPDIMRDVLRGIENGEKSRIEQFETIEKALEHPPRNELVYDDAKKDISEQLQKMGLKESKMVRAAQNYEDAVTNPIQAIHRKMPLSNQEVLKSIVNPDKHVLMNHPSSGPKLELLDELGAVEHLDETYEFERDLEPWKGAGSKKERVKLTGLELLQERHQYSSAFFMREGHTFTEETKQNVNAYVKKIEDFIDNPANKVHYYYQNLLNLSRAIIAQEKGGTIFAVPL